MIRPSGAPPAGPSWKLEMPPLDVARRRWDITEARELEGRLCSKVTMGGDRDLLAHVVQSRVAAHGEANVFVLFVTEGP